MSVSGFTAHLDALNVLQSIQKDHSGGWCIEMLGTARELIDAGGATSDMLALPASGRRIGWDERGDRYRIWRHGALRYGVVRWIRPMRRRRSNVIPLPTRTQLHSEGTDHV